MFQLKNFKALFNIMKPCPDGNICSNVCKFGGNGGEDELFSSLGFGLGLLSRNIDFINVFGIYWE